MEPRKLIKVARNYCYLFVNKMTTSLPQTEKIARLKLYLEKVGSYALRYIVKWKTI